MTATEVVQRNEEKMRILGPVLGRLQSELLQPMILEYLILCLEINITRSSRNFIKSRKRC